jgi:hypothetical protein
MLDLVGKRNEAIKKYQQAADLNVDATWQHNQFGLRYNLAEWARERLRTPFQRIENTDPY